MLVAPVYLYNQVNIVVNVIIICFNFLIYFLFDIAGFFVASISLRSASNLSEVFRIKALMSSTALDSTHV